MDGTSRRLSSGSSHRRLETPHVLEHRSRSRVRERSHSRLRTRSPCRNRDQELSSSHQRVKLLEMQLLQERERLLHAKTRDRSRSRRCERRTPPRHADRRSNRSRSHRSGSTDPERRRAGASQQDGDGGGPQAEHRSVAGHFERSRSPSVSKKYIVDVFKCLKDSLASQPAQDTRSFQKIDHMNILPNFDPSTKNQRVDVWLKKVNECANVYGWDDRTVIHFAMQKLQGLAKTWYEGLNSVLFNWQEWQEKLINAFPCEQNYGQALEEMLKRRSRYNEPIEVYFYEKLALLNQCDIVEKHGEKILV